MQLTDVHIKRGKTEVIKGLSSEFEPGRWCLLGPNGAGKTSLLSAIAGFLPISRGDFHALEISFKQNRLSYLNHVGWMPQEIPTVRGLSVSQYLEYAAWLKGVPKSLIANRLDRVSELTDLKDLLFRQSHQLSGGERKRMGLAAALVHDPTVILLDEPTAGMDPVQRRNFFKTINTFPITKTVIVATHEISELDGAYSHVAVMTNGVIVFRGTVKDFFSQDADDTADVISIYERILANK